MTHNLLSGKKGIIFGVLNNKSLAWSIAKNKKVRINTISQSPTKTTASVGIRGEMLFENLLKFVDDNSPLGNASAEYCAKFCTLMLSDYSRMVTM